MKWIICCLGIVLLIGCRARIKVPEEALIQYENCFVGTKITVGKPLSDEIVAELNSEPDSAKRGVAMGLDAKKYVHIGASTFQVTSDRLILMTDWGIREWVIKDIESRLDALINVPPDKGVST